MVKRIVLWKIKDDQNKQTNLNLLREGLLGLNNKVNDMVALEVGLNYSASDFDIVFIVTFNDPFMLKQFQCHPDCVKVFQLAESISVNMVSCDYMSDVISGSSGNMSNNMSTNDSSNKGFSNANPNSPFNNNNMKRDTLATSASTNDSAFSLPYGGNKNGNNAPMGFNQNQTPNQGAYNGFGNMSPSKNGGVNFTTSENVNQIKFSNGKDNGFNNYQSNEAWKCTKCGKTNSAFINMCSCGKRKPMDNMPAVSGMNPNNIDKRILQSPQDQMMLNTGIVPKMPTNASMNGMNNPMGNPMNNNLMGNNSMGNSMNNNPMGNNPMGNPMNNNPMSPMANSAMGGNKNWVCPSCGKSNSDFMKICICGHRKVENGGNNGIPAYNNNNANTSNNPNNNQNINVNKSIMMSLPKNPGANNIKSPNNNDFFNSFGNGNNNNNSSPMGRPMNNNPMSGGMKNNSMPNNMNNNPMSGGMNNSPMGRPPMGGPPNGMNNQPNNRPGMMGNNRNAPPPGGMNVPPNNMGNPGMNSRMGNPPFGGGNRPQNAPPNNKNMSGNLPPDSWKCPRCGKVLGNFVGQCICGQRKPSRTNMHFN